MNPLAPVQVTDDSQSDNPFVAQSPTLADGWAANASAYGDWIAQQRADGVARGLINPRSGWPTDAAIANIPRQYASALLMGSIAPEASPTNALLQMVKPARELTAGELRQFTNPRDPLEAKFVMPNGKLVGSGDNTHEYIAHSLGYGADDGSIGAMLAETGAARVNAGVGAGSEYGDIHLSARPTDQQMRQLAKIVNSQPETGVSYNGGYDTVRNGAELKRMIDGLTGE